MDKKERNEWLTLTYREANEHLRASDNKRDKAIATYLILVVGFFGLFFDKDFPKELVFPVGFTLGVLGIVISLLITSYRKWHTIYVNTAIVVQHLAYKESLLTEKEIQDTWAKAIGNSDNHASKTLGNYIRYYKGVEGLTSFFFFVISFLPFYSTIADKQNLPYMWIDHVLYVFLMTILAARILDHELSRGHRNSWLLRFGCSEENKTDEKQK